MEFGFNFFPDVGPAEKSAQQYFAESLSLVELGDKLGYGHVRIVEHYFNSYGGYCPNPLVFLSAAAARSRSLRLITGAVLPVFNHPLKLAGEIAMVDAISGGRLEVGFARAFLPHEFRRFGISLDESRSRFDEGLEIVGRLLEEVDVAFEGQYHSFPATTSLPRPTQRPRPPFWIAALSSEESFIRAGQLGHSVMAIPLLGPRMRELIHLYRDAYSRAGHAGNGRVMLAFHMYCAEDTKEAIATAKAPIEHYLESLVDAASDWMSGAESADYPGYQQIIAGLKADSSFEAQVEKGAVWVGSPDDICAQVLESWNRVGPFEDASLQLSFTTLDFGSAQRSMTLFANEVIPAVQSKLAAAQS